LRANGPLFLQPAVERDVKIGARVIRQWPGNGYVCLYSYLGLIGHSAHQRSRQSCHRQVRHRHQRRPRLAGTLTIHTELEETIAALKKTEAALTYSSGYSTNLTVISTLMGRGGLCHLGQASTMPPS